VQAPVDQYQLEIRELRRTLARLQHDEAAPDLINEYEAEVRIHTALYRAARETYDTGRDDRAVRDALSELGFGEWTLENVYSFVYEASMEMPDDGELPEHIDATDFVDSLRRVTTAE
jgi:hypothetical protein